MRMDVITTFPEMFTPVLGASMLKRAQESGAVAFQVHDLRDYTQDNHRTTDDRPYGGGPGMVMKPEPLFEAVEHIRQPADASASRPCVILMCPQGETLTTKLAQELAQNEWLILLCGHYEGVDERIRQGLANREISIGDYVLTGGELPAMVLMDSVCRYVRGVIGHHQATEEESFSSGWLEYPQYTRPAVFRGMAVPEVLLSGDHQPIAAWRQEQSVLRTTLRRPDLLAAHKLKERSRGEE